jgi:hypothetical protein
VEPLPIVDHAAAIGDADALATELAAAFRQRIEQYREWYKLSEREATDRATGESSARKQRVLNCPPAELSWQDLESLAQIDPDRAQQRWEEVKQAAREELRSGHRAARFIEGRDNSCWDRARFLALRAELSEAWRPRNAQEQHLVDQLAQWQALLEEWQEALIIYMKLPCGSGRRACKGARSPEPPRVSDVEAVEGAGVMVERLQRLYLRARQALQDQRRIGPRMDIRRAAQVTIGHQQVNGVGASDVLDTGSRAG